jgi:hypothetical protein
MQIDVKEEVSITTEPGPSTEYKNTPLESVQEV